MDMETAAENISSETVVAATAPVTTAATTTSASSSASASAAPAEISAAVAAAVAAAVEQEFALKLARAFNHVKEGKKQGSALKDLQKQAIRAIAHEHISTVVVSVKTGGGKTAIFQTIPYLLSDIRHKSQVAIIISPLTSLITRSISKPSWIGASL
jgi:superfamily II DNA helicase RecQ